MRFRPLLVGVVAAVATTAAALAAEVVVLRGGTRIELKSPWVRQGNNALLTRADGTLLSVPVSEIDREATSVAQAVPALPPRSSELVRVPATPAEAARASRERPKARIRVTDADVGHYVESPTVAEQAGEEKPEVPSGAGRLEVIDYTQERAGGQLMIRGSLRNAGATAATASRLTITAMNPQGQPFLSTEATLSNGTIEAHRTVSFSASLPVGEQPVGSLRFAPRWIASAPPSPAAPAQAQPASGTTTAVGSEGAPSGATGTASAASAAAAAGAQSAPPAKTDSARPQTPYGQGSLYAAPPPSVSFSAPADGKSGYIPGAASPENQPKPPQ